MALKAKLKPDSEDLKGMTAEQLERRRSLGYVRKRIAGKPRGG